MVNYGCCRWDRFTVYTLSFDLCLTGKKKVLTHRGHSHENRLPPVVMFSFRFLKKENALKKGNENR